MISVVELGLLLSECQKLLALYSGLLVSQLFCSIATVDYFVIHAHTMLLHFRAADL